MYLYIYIFFFRKCGFHDFHHFADEIVLIFVCTTVLSYYSFIIAEINIFVHCLFVIETRYVIDYRFGNIDAKFSILLSTVVSSMYRLYQAHPYPKGTVRKPTTHFYPTTCAIAYRMRGKMVTIATIGISLLLL